jgi:hypothetical protein
MPAKVETTTAQTSPDMHSRSGVRPCVNSPLFELILSEDEL